ncbi:hypothetical protein BDK51DRAFT_48641 [Blyttiomyces helicus]|uniref:Uncharacterized protein n=1 Tax=Blyttiomyces helicus TaxID=388810 RepID=A0A4P9VWT3_9FUNG|nr:hypothetical protein BDK51DRAFT_48641 [Blyttiomyces helicus]|eukprot:RKO84179.1 hypothetical protein BDK51DRAFT_48641 [Blyttiomyces helicus]
MRFSGQAGRRQNEAITVTSLGLATLVDMEPENTDAAKMVKEVQTQLKRAAFSGAIKSAPTQSRQPSPSKTVASLPSPTAASLGSELLSAIEPVKSVQSKKKRTKKAKPCHSAPQSLKEMAAKTVAREFDRTPLSYIPLLNSLEEAYVIAIHSHMAWPSIQLLGRPLPSVEPYKHRALITSTFMDTAMKSTEDYYRHLFANRRDHALLADPLLTLIPVFQVLIGLEDEGYRVVATIYLAIFTNWSTLPRPPTIPCFQHLHLFNHESGLDHDGSIPTLFGSDFDYDESSFAICGSINEFKRAFHTFSMGQLRYVNLNNVLIAGGSVLAALLPQPRGVNLSDYFRLSFWKSSDIDIFCE